MTPSLGRNVEPPPLETGQEGEWLDLPLSHWRVRQDGDGVLWLVLVQRGVATNTLSVEVVEQLSQLLAEAERRRPPALVIRSGKRDSFIVGADIQAYHEATPHDAHAMVVRAQQVVTAVADLTVPSIALIHGACLGGGLQLALACDYRIARGDALLGLPEVRFGVHPALGGTARLPALVGPDQALRMMLGGESLTAAEARACGLVDVVGEEQVFANAVRAAAAGSLPLQRPGARARALTLRPTRRMIASRARREVARRVRAEHYPAPYRLLELWERHGASAASLLAHETASFAELVTGATARNLLRTFTLAEGLRDQGRQRAGRQDDPLDHVHVVGAGTMGAAIAAWCALHGLLVTVEDRSAALLAPALRRAAELFHAHGLAARAAGDRLIPDLGGAGRGKADLLIEAVPEDVELKRRVLHALEAAAKPQALLASTTSAIGLEEIGAAMRQPQRLAGLHFFNPVRRMRLVEVVHHRSLEPAALDRLMGFVVAIERVPVTVRDAPGHLVNRILAPYLEEALRLLDEGIAAEQVDAAAEHFGMPVGPLQLMDLLGLDTALEVAESLYRRIDAPLPAALERLRGKTAAGELGVSSGKGFHRYDAAGVVQKPAFKGEPAAVHADRLLLPMVNAAVACLAAGLAEDADAVDAAMVFGGGFPPFRGGPLRYASEHGSAAVRQRLAALAEAYGSRFAPDSAWPQVFGVD
ncbi:MAG: 3-hydroxyacyl-CoA dehydrogenase NAD-binding domain-containing protein [Pseudomonadales bacterium]